MKKYLFLLIGLLLSSNSFALEFDVIRTPETPGFFQIQLNSTDEIAPFRNDFVFIQNYPARQASRYQGVEATLEELGYTVIDKKSADLADTTASFFALGESFSTIPSLTITDEDNAQNELEAFRQTHLTPIVVKNLQLSTGGNMRNLVTNTNVITTNNLLTIVGKFTSEQKTRFELVGDTAAGTTSFSSIIDLSDKRLSNHPLSTQLPFLWESLQTKEKKSAKKSQLPSYIFPLLLFVVGGIFILWALKEAFVQRMRARDAAWEQAENEEYIPETIKKSAENHKDNIPFEVVIKGK